MVKRTDDFGQRYSEAVEELNNAIKEKDSERRTVKLFFSFDIVNSSSYKDINYLGWPMVLTTLLQEVQNEVLKIIPSAQLWRILGDEIIFFVTLKDLNELYDYVNDIFNILVTYSKILRSGKFYEHLPHEGSVVDTKGLEENSNISLQSAAWLAIVLENGYRKVGKFDNIFKEYTINDSRKIYEFLGRDIDTGFRIKKQTCERRLVLSLELAYLLSKRTEFLSGLHIITYRALKGVWQGALYPIIWYYNEKLSDGIPFLESFYYDETSKSALSKEYFLNRENKDGDIASYMYEYTDRALEKIVLDRNLSEKIDEIKVLIDKTGTDYLSHDTNLLNTVMELHCAVVCCDVKNKRVMIVKRSKRPFMPGLWEFGCAKAQVELNLQDAITKEYKNDFNIDIEIVCDKTRDDIEPKPIALYQVEKVDKKQKGVIMVAFIKPDSQIDEEYIKNKGKHEKAKWITQGEVNSFDEDAVTDFKNTLNYIFDNWETIFEGVNV